MLNLFMMILLELSLILFVFAAIWASFGWFGVMMYTLGLLMISLLQNAVQRWARARRITMRNRS